TDAAKVRLSLFAHLSTQSKRNVRLERIDHVWAGVKGDRQALGEQIKCVAVIEGEIGEYDSSFLGVYSRVAVGVDLRMIRAADGTLLWEGQHTAVSHGGTVPLDPVGLAMGVVDAVTNVRDEQLLRVTDDLARRLISTIPDNKVVAMDDPVGEPLKVVAAPPPPPPAAAPASAPVAAPAGVGDSLAAAELALAAGDHAAALLAAERAIAADPQRARAWFVKGRVMMLDKNFDLAEPAFLKAVTLDRGNALYLDGLGAVNAQKGATDRALAAYRMAIAAEPADGFAWYNSGVIYYNAGKGKDAANAFFGAAMAYLKAGDYPRAERALSDLKDLAKSGIPVQTMVRTIEQALADLTRRKT
ncbi:MAG TPA: tetratricopeptide repeat protein, partial [Rhodospirillaceae bacterium]|nr:tetratricopeptide repeat protein [Rhodospirillaceae bacterium]